MSLKLTFPNQDILRSLDNDQLLKLIGINKNQVVFNDKNNNNWILKKGIDVDASDVTTLPKYIDTRSHTMLFVQLIEVFF